MIKIEIYEDDNITKIKTLEDLTFEINALKYTIKQGFVSDGMSIPKFFWRVISPQIDAITLEPSIKHDYLYQVKITTRLEADQMYRDWLLENGFAKWKANVVYYGLRWFGASHW